MNFFNFDLKKAFLIILIVAVPVFLMTVDQSKVEKSFIFRAFAKVAGTTQTVYHTFVSSIYHTADTYLNLIHIKKRNRTLKADNKQLRSRLALLEETEREKNRLSALLRFQENQNLSFIPAKVVGRDPVSKYQLLTINRGLKHGVRDKMAVIAARKGQVGMAGYIFRAFSHFSQMILLTDPRASIPALVQRSRVYGVVEGLNIEASLLKYLKRRDDVKVGDIVVSSDLSQEVTGGFRVGKIRKIHKPTNGLTQEVEVIPFVNSSQLEEVLVVNKSKNREQKNKKQGAKHGTPK